MANVTLNYTFLLNNASASELVGETAAPPPVSGDLFEARVLSRPMQAAIVVVLIGIAATLNGLIICNIRKNEIKVRTVTFMLIEYMCILDTVGAIFLLPFPFYVSVNGSWALGSTVCSLNAVMNVGVWIQHFLIFLLLKFDRTAAACLPIGRYPPTSISCIRGCVLLSILLSFSLSTTLTLVCGGNFHQVVLLCTPKVPRAVFVTMLSLYTLAMGCAAFGYLAMIAYFKHLQRKVYCTTSLQIKDYRQNIHSAWMSFNITAVNMFVYIPTMFVIGNPQLQEVLPRIIFLMVDIVFYSEFFLHPLILLSLSSKLRKEIKTTVVNFVCRCCHCC